VSYGLYRCRPGRRSAGEVPREADPGTMDATRRTAKWVPALAAAKCKHLAAARPGRQQVLCGRPTARRPTR